MRIGLLCCALLVMGLEETCVLNYVCAHTHMNV